MPTAASQIPFSHIIGGTTHWQSLSETQSLVRVLPGSAASQSIPDVYPGAGPRVSQAPNWKEWLHLLPMECDPDPAGTRALFPRSLRTGRFGDTNKHSNKLYLLQYSETCTIAGKENNALSLGG